MAASAIYFFKAQPEIYAQKLKVNLPKQDKMYIYMFK